MCNSRRIRNKECTCGIGYLNAGIVVSLELFISVIAAVEVPNDLSHYLLVNFQTVRCSRTDSFKLAILYIINVVRIYMNILGVLEIHNYRLIFLLEELDVAVPVILDKRVSVYIDGRIIRIVTRIDNIPCSVKIRSYIRILGSKQIGHCLHLLDSRINNIALYIRCRHAGFAQAAEPLVSAACEFHTVDIVQINVHNAGSLCIAYGDSTVRIISDIGRIGKLCKICYEMVARRRFRKVALKVLSVFRISEVVDREVCLHMTLKSKSVSGDTKRDTAAQDILIGVIVVFIRLEQVDDLIVLCGQLTRSELDLLLELYLLCLCKVACFNLRAILACKKVANIALLGSLEESYLCRRLVAGILINSIIGLLQVLIVFILNNKLDLVGVVSYQL